MDLSTSVFPKAAHRSFETFVSRQPLLENSGWFQYLRETVDVRQ